MHRFAAGWWFALWLATLAPATVADRIRFDIKEDAAVRSFRLAAQQAGVEILLVPSVVGEVRTNAVQGVYPPHEAFDLMVAGTSLIVIRDPGSGAYAVTKRTNDRPVTAVRSGPQPPKNESAMNPHPKPARSRTWAVLTYLALGAAAQAQSAGVTPLADNDDVVTLTPFVVDATKDTGYRATETLAGTRIRTDLADVGSSISVLTSELLRDLGATNNETALAYALNTEVGGPRGNFSGGVQMTGQNTNELALFANPNGNTRVRGLTSAQNTRNFFMNDIPWDGYTVSRVDLQRGPNAILFGLGSPAGVVNASIHGAEFRDRSLISTQFDGFGSIRASADFNRELLDQELAVRVTVLENQQKFRQEPAFSDDRRYFGALSYSPQRLNRDGMSFNVSGNFEKGGIDSNRPRIFSPVDQITGWWQPESVGGLNRRTFDPALTRPLTDTANPAFLPSLGGYRSAGIVLDPATGTTAFGRTQRYGARRPDGSIITDATGSGEAPFSLSRYGLRGLHEWAGPRNLPFASFGGYDPTTLTDASVFDFYNLLIDGDNKGEWTDWTVGDVSLSHTFFDDRLGYNLAYFRQDLDRGQWAALGWQNRIMIDVNTHLGDGSANPNAGRAFIEEEMRDTNNTGSSQRDAGRIQVFAKHDFAKGRTGFFTRLLGEHRLTGALSQENQKTDNRSIKGQNFDPTTLAKFTNYPYIEGGGDGTLHLAFRQYLSGDLRGVGSPSGINLANMAVPFMRGPGGTTTVRYFDNTWIAAPSVDPNAFWQSPDPFDTDPNRLRQALNPANYRGWTTTQANVVTFFSDQTINGMPARDYLTSTARLSEFNVDSLTLVWQGYLWDRAIVGTYGYRKDEARNYLWQSGYRFGPGRYRLDTQSADLSPASYNFANPLGTVTELETTTRNWSIAAHVNRLLGRRDFLPFNLSLYYNEGENFEPLAGRFDVSSQPLAPPSGKTREYSMLLSTKDQKYSARLTNYRTEMENASSTGSIGNMWALEQSLAFTANQVRDYVSGRMAYSNYSSDPAAVARLRDVIAPAWLKFEQDLRAAFPDYVTGWMGSNTRWGTSDYGAVTAVAPTGFSYTENSVSRGLELELTANPLPNWRLMANASRTEASRTDVPGVAFKAVADWVDERIMTTDAGLAPVWWAQNTFGLRNVGPYSFFRPDYLKLKALNGQSNPEIRKWRANLVTSYDFVEGRLAGAGVGGAYRWEDKSVIDYAPMRNADGSDGINLNAPVWAKGNRTFDLWFSYHKKISDKVRWRIQVNVYNVFGKNELVPVTASVDHVAIQGVGAITPTTVIPMRPSGFIIREGRSWTVANTFEF